MKCVTFGTRNDDYHTRHHCNGTYPKCNSRDGALGNTRFCHEHLEQVVEDLDFIHLDYGYVWHGEYTDKDWQGNEHNVRMGRRYSLLQDAKETC